MTESKDIRKREALIKIHSTQKVGADKDAIDLLTTGSFSRRRNKYYICYEETEASGFNGSRTMLKFDPEAGCITMNRSGSAHAQLIIEEGRRHQCNYDTGFGSMTIGVLGNGFKSSLSDEGGDLTFQYSLDVDTSLASENRVDITVALAN